jgi:hypothetical protein
MKVGFYIFLTSSQTGHESKNSSGFLFCSFLLSLFVKKKNKEIICYSPNKVSWHFQKKKKRSQPI